MKKWISLALCLGLAAALCVAGAYPLDHDGAGGGAVREFPGRRNG